MGGKHKSQCSAESETQTERTWKSAGMKQRQYINEVEAETDGAFPRRLVLNDEEMRRRVRRRASRNVSLCSFLELPFREAASNLSWEDAKGSSASLQRRAGEQKVAEKIRFHRNAGRLGLLALHNEKVSKEFALSAVLCFCFKTYSLV